MADTISGNNGTSESLILGSSRKVSKSSTIDFVGDTDWFKINLSEGYGYVFRVTGFDSGGGSLADPLLSLYNFSGTQIGLNNNFGGTKDGLIYFAPTSSTSYNATSAGTFFVSAEANGSAIGTYTISMELDSLDSTSSTAVLPANSSIRERIYTPGDSDWTKVTMQANVVYVIDAIGYSGDGIKGVTDGLHDPILGLRDASGNLVFVDDDGGDKTNARIIFITDVTATYYIETASADSNDTGTYQLALIANPYKGNIASGETKSGNLSFDGDIDYYSFNYTGEKFLFSFDGDVLGELLDSDWNVIYTTEATSGQTIPQLNSGAYIWVIRQLQHAGATNYTFTISDGDNTDTTAPFVLQYSPADESANMLVGANIVLTFNESIKFIAGTILLKKSTGELVESFAVGSSHVTILGTVLTINPTQDLLTSTDYRLEISTNAIKDLHDLPYAGLTDYNFRTQGPGQGNGNSAPVAMNGAATIAEDTILSGSLPSATDAQGDTITYSRVTDPLHGALVVNTNGTFSYTPTLNFNGGDSFTFGVSDGLGASNTYNFVITVSAVNDAPLLNTPLFDQTASIGANFFYAIPVGAFTDVEGSLLSYSATLSSGQSLPSWLSFFPADGTFNGVVPGAGGVLDIRVTASDGSLTTSDEFRLTVLSSPTNRAPVVANPLIDQTWTEGTALQYVVPSTIFSDPDGNALSYTATQSNGSALPSWLSFSTTTRTFTGTATTGSADITVRVTATDTGGLSAFDDVVFFTPAAASQNHAPVVANALPDLNWTEGTALQYVVQSNTFTDPDGNTLSYTATQSSGAALPSWLSFNTTTRTFTGTATTGSADITVRVTATDTGGLSAFDDVVFFTPAAASQNHAPVVANALPDLNWTEGTALKYVVPSNTFTDSDGNALSYTATQSSGAALPSWLSFNTTTRTFTGTATTASADITIRVTATDTGGLSAFDDVVFFTPAAASQNHAPVVANALPDLLWTEGTALQYVVPSNTFTDPDGNALSYTATQSSGSALPSWLSFNATTRTFTGTAPTDSADITVRVTAKDTGGLSVFDDTLFSTPGTQTTSGRTIYGTDGADKLYGGKGDDSLYAGKGNDLLRGGPGNDFLSGAEDDDIAFFSGRYSEYTITFDANTTHYTVVDSQANRDGVDTLLVVETLKFSDIAVTATSILNGTSTNDTLHAGKGGDSLHGTSSNDSFTGLDGDDLIDGAAGIDTAIYRGTYSRYVLGFDGKGTTIKDVSGADGTDTLVAIERLVFSDKHVAIDLNGSAGIVVKLIGAVFGAAAVNNHTYVGIGLSLADGGMSPAALAEYAMQASGKSTPTDVVNLLWTHVMGTAPTAEQAQSYINQLASGTITAGQLAALAGDSFLNEVNIDLVGLITHGVEYV